jgi:hypothetical protein
LVIADFFTAEAEFAGIFLFRSSSIQKKGDDERGGGGAQAQQGNYYSCCLPALGDQEQSYR